MTLGTSPQWGILFRGGTEITNKTGASPWWQRAFQERVRWQVLARWAAALHLGALGLVMTMAWHDPDATGSEIGGLQAIQLAFLLMTGAAAAALTLRNTREESSALDLRPPQPPACVDQLLAQMSHELRTPLNAMIGFSEVMLRELYGPLGHARYQEYAAHISQSGGQLLRSAEDALAVTETMSAVMADRLAGRCERVAASALIREAWSGLVPLHATVKLSVSNCTACDIPCERRATVQALQHLLREAASKIPEGTIEIRGRRRDGARSIVISVAGPVQPDSDPRTAAEGAHSYPAPDGPGLRVMLARLLLEMEGASLCVWETDAGSWSACLAFPPRG